MCAVKAGALGYVLKNSAGDGMVHALHLVQRGRAYFSPPVAQLFQNDPRIGPPDVEDRYELLTERERQIHQLLAEGNSKGDRQPSEFEPAHGGDPPLADHGENEPAQQRGTGIERRSPRSGYLIL
jgi:hypothetical protein